MVINDSIKEIAQNAAEPLLNISKNGAKLIKHFDIRCSQLKDYNYEPIQDSENFKLLFNDLQEMTGPCLYFFEITSEHSSYEIVNKIKEYSITPSPKTTPAIKMTIPDSKFLYVGKVKRFMWGRLIQHFGYYKVRLTQGLQLFYWTQELNLTIRLTVLEFEPEMINLMEVLENELAKQLKPILGKHK